MKRLLLSAVAITLVATAVASADTYGTIDVRYAGNKGDSVNFLEPGGAHNGTVTAPYYFEFKDYQPNPLQPSVTALATPNTYYWGFCIDIRGTVSTAGDSGSDNWYQDVGIKTLDAITPAIPGAVAGWETRVAKLITAYNLVGAPGAPGTLAAQDSTGSELARRRALGAAVWEVMYETTGTYSLSSGTATMTGLVSDANTVATNWLNNLNSYAIATGILALDFTNTSYQEQGLVLALPTSAVPEPASLVALLGLGLVGGVGAFARRRRRR